MTPLSSMQAAFLTIRQRVGRTAVLVSLTVLAGCDRVKQAVSSPPALQPGVDPAWHADSVLLAAKPTILFRTLEHKQGRAVVPIATTGAFAFRQLKLSGPGWRAFDVNYLRDGNTLTGIRAGRAAGPIHSTRGMWESSGQLDSIPRCNLIPAGLTDAPSSIRLAVAGAVPSLKPVTALSSGELQAAVATVPTLIAPSVGISITKLAQYTREVHVLATGATTRPSILVIFTDTRPVADSVQPINERPRQLVVVLDKGVYGYRPSYKFATVGNALSDSRVTFLDFIDVDNDGRAELFFGLKYRHIEHWVDATQALAYQNDAWREIFRESARCS